MTGLIASLVVWASGTPAGNIVLFAGYVVIGVAVPGVFVWRWLLRGWHLDEQRRPTWLEDAALGSIAGFGLQLPVYLVGLVVGVPLLVVLLPVTVGIVSLLPVGRRVWQLPTRSAGATTGWGLAGVTVYGVLWLATKVFPDRPLWLPPNRTPSVDETFHQALVGELAHRFPPQVPFLLGTRLDYHWFVHAQIATARWVTGIDSVVMLRQLMPALMLIMTVWGLGAVTFRLVGRRGFAVLAPALLVLGGFHQLGADYRPSVFSEPFMSSRYVSSPSQSYGAMMALPVLLLIFEVLRPGRHASRFTWLALGLTLLALAGSKATFLPIFLVAALLMLLVRLLLERRVDRSSLGLVGLLALATAFAQIVLFGGQGGAMQFAPWKTFAKALTWQDLPDTVPNAWLMGGALLVGWLLYGIGAVGLVRSGRWRDPRALWMLATVPVGTAVSVMFFRSGLSQLWFQRSVAEVLVVLSAWGLSALLPSPLSRRTGWQLVAVGALTGLAAYLLMAVLNAYVGVKGASLHSLAATLGIVAVIVLIGLLAALLLRRRGRRPVLVIAFTVAALLGLSGTNAYSLMSDRLQGRPLARVGDFDALFAPGGVAAADWLRNHSTPDDVIATNAHCLSPTSRRCDNRNFWISAYTERRVVIEGWGYTAPTNDRADPDAANAFIPTPYPQRLLINDEAFTQPSEETVTRLVDTYDVRWLFVDKAYPASVSGLDTLTGLLKKRYENKGYVVYQVLR